MKRKILALLMVIFVVSTMFATITSAEETQSMNGFYKIGSKENITITPYTTDVVAQAIDMDVDDDGVKDTFYINSNRMKVSYAVDDNEGYYGVLLVEGTALPTKDNAIYYIDQVSPKMNVVNFDVYPLLPTPSGEDEELMDFTLYISCSKPDADLISIPVSYAMNAFEEEISIVEVTGVSLNKTSIALAVGETETLTATVLPSDATNKNVSWSSSNTSIATVSGGVVTAVGEGTATITVTTIDGGKTASCVVEVAEPNSVFTFSDVSGKPGETVKVKLSLKTDKEINSIAISDIVYDSSLLSFVDFSDYEHIEALTILPPSFDKDKKAIVIGLKTPTAFDGDICTLNFKINDLADEGSTSTIAATSVLKNGSNTIGSKVATGVVTVRVQLLGDIDGNESVDIDDAVLLFQYSMLPDLFPISYVGNVDFDKNGTVDIDDAVLLFQYSMLPDLFPIE